MRSRKAGGGGGARGGPPRGGGRPDCVNPKTVSDLLKVLSSFNAPSQDRNIYIALVKHLSRNDLLPAIMFTFSRKRCDDNAYMLATVCHFCFPSKELSNIPAYSSI